MSWRDVYRDQLRAEAANAVNFTNALDELDTPSSARLVSTVEVRWRAESVLDGQGPGIPHRRGHIAGGCFIGRRGWLWTSTPVWYSEFVQQPGPQVGMEDWSSAAHAVRQQVYRARAANRKTVSITRRRHRRPRDQLFFRSRDGTHGGTVPGVA